MRLAALLTAVLAAACAHAPSSRAERWPGQDTCLSYGGRGCHEAGWSALTGPGPAPDDRAAARFFMMGCQTGSAASCADLAALYAAGRGVRKDDGRACALGLAEACLRAGRPAPDPVRTPTASLPPPSPAPADAAPSPANLDHALAYARYFVDEPLHERLAMTQAALAAEPPAPLADVHDVRPLTTLRRAKAERCLPVVRFVSPEGDRAADGPERQPSPAAVEYVGRPAPVTAWASFLLQPDGSTAGVRVVANLADPKDEPEAQEAREERLAMERCVAEVITGWEFPRPRVGGRIWLKLTGNGPERIRTVEQRTETAPGPFVRPRMKEPGCVARSVVIPAGLPAGSLHSYREAFAKFAIAPDGSVGRFLILTDDLPFALAEAIARAVHRCEWVPGTAAGKPTTTWVFLPVRFISH